MGEVRRVMINHLLRKLSLWSVESGFLIGLFFTVARPEPGGTGQVLRKVANGAAEALTNVPSLERPG